MYILIGKLKIRLYFLKLTAANFDEPPAKANEKEAPIFKKFRFFAFKSMTYKLQYPAQYEHSEAY